MRIALNAIGQVGVRTGRILTAERDLVALGLWGDTSSLGQDRRTIRISSLDGYDTLVTDDEDGGSALAGLAADDGVSCALPGEASEEAVARFGGLKPRAGSPPSPPSAVLPPLGGETEESGEAVLLTRCSIDGLAETLAAHEAARTDETLETMIAWTEPGKPLRRGEPVAFPEPVGARWGDQVDRVGTTTRIAVPVDGDWAGATVTVFGRIGGETEKRIIGIADEVEHLQAIALAAGAVVAATTDLTGVITPADVAEQYLAAALRMGLGVATYTLD